MTTPTDLKTAIETTRMLLDEVCHDRTVATAVKVAALHAGTALLTVEVEMLRAEVLRAEVLRDMGTK